jgi:hypothetical protein
VSGEAGFDEVIFEPGIKCIEHAQARAHYFRADTVAADDGYRFAHGGFNLRETWGRAL